MSVNEKMTALADEVRELSGTESAKSIDAMTSDIDAANTEINEQAGLIEQIVTVLENKAAGGGGSGGDAQIKTCTVTISTTYYGVSEARIFGYSYTAFENGEIVVKQKSIPVDGFASAVISDVVCGSAITIMLNGIEHMYTYNGNVIVTSFGTWSFTSCPVAILCAPNVPGSSSSIVFDCQDQGGGN